MGKYLFFMTAILVFTSVQAGFTDTLSAKDKLLLAGADPRIEKIRKADAAILVTYPDDSPAKDVKVKVEQVNHRFLFGCNIFPLFDYKGEQHETYGKEFADLLNYATLPFYWGGYEPKPGVTHAEDVKKIAEWCKVHGIETKGHPLVWHEVYPGWAPSDVDETKTRLESRVKEIVHGFKGLIDRWDVVNEATVSDRFDNGVGHWAKRDGAATMVDQSMRWAREANSKATLLYNDFNVSPDYEKLLGDLNQMGSPYDAIGIQSHMHGGEWSLERAWDVCETYSRFGKPINFTELTVLSGENGWEKPAPWPTTPEGEKHQAAYVSRLYTLLFSHPAVEAITWWDFMDGGWQGAPAGLVHADLTPKPVYKSLMTLIKRKWWTKLDTATGDDGICKIRGFMGKYKVTVTTPKGSKTVLFDLEPGRNVWNIELAGPKGK